MTYKREGDRVTLDLKADDFDCLLMALGYAAGAATTQDMPEWAWGIMRLANVVNEGNPNFTPYEIPKEFARRADPA